MNNLVSIFLSTSVKPAPPPTPPPAPLSPLEAARIAPLVKSSSVSSVLDGARACSLTQRHSASLPPSPFASLPRPAPVGCGPSNAVNTVIVAGDLYGKTEALDLILARASPVAKVAADVGNEVHLALVGDVWPSRWPTDPAVPSMAKVLLGHKNRGVDHASGLQVKGDNIHLVVGGRELRALRILDCWDKGEITGREAYMASSLPNGPPLEGANAVYDEALRLAEGSLKECSKSQDSNVLRLAMLYKIEALLTLDLGFGYENRDAPGLLRDIVRGSLWRRGDYPHEPLLAWLNGCAMLCGQRDVGWLDARLRRLLEQGPGGAATEHCQMVLAIFFAHVDDVLEPLLQVSKLVDSIAPPAGEEPDRCLWLLHAGTGSPKGSIVRRVPTDAKMVDGVPVMKWSEEKLDSLEEWQDAMNGLLVEATTTFPKMATMRILSALSMGASRTGPTQSMARNVLAGLEPSDGDHAAVGAVGHVSNPFAIARRAFEVGCSPLSAKTTASWMNVDVAAFAPNVAYACYSWCGTTKTALEVPVRLDRSRKLTCMQACTDSVAGTLAAEVGDATLLGMCGVLGPTVVVGKEGEVFRVVHWRDADGKSKAITLLHESYLRHALNDYRAPVFPTSPGWSCAGTAYSFLVLRKKDQVAMKTLVSSAEAEGEHEAKVWMQEEHEQVNAAEKAAAYAVMAGAPADAFRDGKGLPLGGEGDLVLPACACSDDPLAGLFVRWLCVEGSVSGFGGGLRYAIDTHGWPGGAQSELETVVGMRV